MNVALKRGRDFANSILKDVEVIQNSEGMRVMRGVKSLLDDSEYDIVIRSLTQHFWEECINEVMTPDMTVRVCAIGTPGIGKTISTAFLIRMLLLRRYTVVYRLASEPFYWEFKWKPTGHVVNVHPKSRDIYEVESLKTPSTFYIVDPMSTTTSCFPPYTLEARTIIVSSPDGTHWRGENFEKKVGNVIGTFRFFSMWDLNELLEARSYFGTLLTIPEVEARFRLVGGVPRHVFLEEKYFPAVLRNQNDAVESLTEREAQQIIKGKLDSVGTFASNQPKSALIGYAMAQNQGEAWFSSRKVEIVSPIVAEKILEKLMEFHVLG